MFHRKHSALNLSSAIRRPRIWDFYPYDERLIFNRFSPPGITDEGHSMAWLYEEAERQWMKWLPNEASNTIRYGGFYTALIKPGLRIISMNMNYCYTLNYWTFSTSKDPASGLTWMSQILQSAEDNQEKVGPRNQVFESNPFSTLRESKRGLFLFDGYTISSFLQFPEIEKRCIRFSSVLSWTPIIKIKYDKAIARFKL